MSSQELTSFITYNPVSVSEDTHLDEMIQMLDSYGFHHWPVVNDDHHLVGVVSDVDILRTLQRPETDTFNPTNCRAADIMSRKLLTVSHTDSARVALRQLVSHRVHSLPVIDELRLVGMITSTDFLRECSYGEIPVSRECVTTVMLNPAEPITLSNTLDDAMRAMQDAGTECVAVVQDGCPLGVLSRRQVRTIKCRQAVLATTANRSEDYEMTPVAGLVTDAPTLRPGHRLFEAAAMMVEHKVQALAIVNQARRLLGIITEEEILRVMFERYL